MTLRGRSATTDYPPLLFAGLVMILLLAAMPSALNLPQSTPTETLEYAPVPPEDDINPPPLGNLSSLGLGSSNSLRRDASPPPPEDAAAAAARVGKNPRTKRCVGNPPRQTEDQLSPPCVAYFRGDNGGATYQGVTKDEIRILFYFDGAFSWTSSRGLEQTPTGTYYDLAEPQREEEEVHLRQLRTLQRYFNERYQTYGRFVHFHAYYTRHAEGPTPEQMVAEAEENYQKIKPFAVVPTLSFLAADPYIEHMARHRVMNFGALSDFAGQRLRPADFYRRFAPLIWGFPPSIEQQAKVFSAYVCRKVVPYPVSFSGNAGDQGKPRRLGLYRTQDADHPGMVSFAREVRNRIEACGGNIVDEQIFNSAGHNVDGGNSPSDGAAAVAGFSQKGVTTVIWAQGYETQFGTAADNAQYYPEIVIAGDDVHEGNDRARYQPQSVWANAWIVTPRTKQVPFEQRPCFQAQREGDPSTPQEDSIYGCVFYDALRQMFTGIQVAGPRIDPESIEKGFRAIPAVESKSASLPACYYDAGDFTCVKDAISMWWDPNGNSESSEEPGCWKTVENFRRRIAPTWPETDVPTERNRQADQCNEINGGFTFHT